MLAMIAASTRIDSSPSRKTKTAMSSAADAGLMFGVGFGLPLRGEPLPDQHAGDEQRGGNYKKMRTASRSGFAADGCGAPAH